MKKIGTALNLVSATDFDNSTQFGWAELETYATVSSATNGPDLVSAVTNRVFVPQTPETFAYDADGNLIEDGRFRYWWNGENRMVRAEEKMPPEGRNAHVIVYAYDHQGRNVVKDGSLQIWDAYNIVVEDAATSNATINLWDLDIDGTMQGAGGVGGLLAVARGSDASLPLYDANGNITEYVDSLGGVESHTDYSAFGRGLMRNGMKSYSHGFSTKPWCRKSGLVEYQMRKYMPWHGRWMSHDPINEIGELNLYGFIDNSSVHTVDVGGEYVYAVGVVATTIVVSYMIYRLVRAWKNTADKMKSADINDLTDVVDKSIECARDTVKEVLNVSPFPDPTDPIIDIIKPDIISPLVDPAFEKVRPFRRTQHNTSIEEVKIRRLD